MFKLRLKNYRGFLNEEFTFSRINILIGENSAGKSSIFKFLLALKQSLRSPNRRESNLTLSDTESDLGNYYETIYNHEIERNLGFSFELYEDYFEFFLKTAVPASKSPEDNKKLIKIKQMVIDNLGGKISSNTLIDFEISNDLCDHSKIKMSISNETVGKIEIFHKKNILDNEKDIYLIGENPKCKIIFESVFFNKTFTLEDVEFEKQGFLSIIVGENLKDQIKQQSELDISNVEIIYWHIGYLLISQNYIQMQLSQIEYINSLVFKNADRVYIDNDKKNVRQVKTIKDLIDFIDTNTAKPKFKEILRKILSDFGIADDFYIKKDGYTKELRIILNGIDSNIKDIGFGVSLQLPIFAQAIISEGTTRIINGNEMVKGETLFIEQPEIHLHPNLQAKFIETLLGIGNDNNYFIETHSEHIIRMLQIIVKSKKYGIKSSDISIHYFKKKNKNMIKSPHTINSETGKLTPNFPKGFYDVSYDLAFQLMD